MSSFYIDIPGDTRAETCCGEHAPVEPNYACTREKGHTGPHACDFAVWGETDSATLRDEFAKAALTGMMADPNEGRPCDEIATSAYKLADAMMKARGA